MMLSRTGPTFVLLAVLTWALTACGGGNGDNSQFNGEGDGGGDADSANADDAGDGTTNFLVGDGSWNDDARTSLPDGCIGSSCFDGAVCGDGVIEAPETCDDGNSTPGDGCSGICQIEPGYICPTPDKPCVKVYVCGNGVIDPGETCDDGNDTSGDGCSSNCQVEPGWTCTGGTVRELGDAAPPPIDSGMVALSDASPPTPSKCFQDKCGDGIVETGETCDDGNDVSGDGCSSTCQIEPGWACPAPNTACVATACGDGIVAGTEQCDDGNTVSGDGCSSTCQVEAGWVCPTPDEKCIAANCGDGIVAGNEQCDLGATNGPTTGCSTTCTIEPGFMCVNSGTPLATVCTKTACGDGRVQGSEECDDGNLIPFDGCSPTCTIEPKCSGGTCTAVCGDGLVFPGEQCDLGSENGPNSGCSTSCTTETGWKCNNVTEPPAASLSIPILYRDMLYSGTTVPGMGHPDFQNPCCQLVTGLVNNTLGTDGEPVWLSDDGSAGSPFLSGPVNFCWWYHQTGCDGAGSTNPYDQLVYLDLNGNPTLMTLTQQTGQNLYQFSSTQFYPLDNLGWDSAMYGDPQTDSDCSGTTGHNFSFTSELHYPFTYQASAPAGTFTFVGDDDVHGFINGQQVVDLGGVHGAATGSITLDAPTASSLGLVDQGWYSIDVFQAERHTCGSDYTLTLADFVHQVSSCSPICGDGVIEGSEVCDDGVNNGGYGGCDPGCMMRGPYCGDDIVENPPEQCDDGSNLVTYGGTMQECGPGCKWAPYCGDDIKNGPEQCDQGTSNQPLATAYGPNVCTAACTLAPYCGDAVVQTQDGEKCDNGVNNGSYGTCNPNCTLAPYCGDGIVNGPEKCDNGSNNEPSSTAYGQNVCTTSCTPAPYCGDGIVETQFGEQCDSTPGCTATCKNGGAQ